MTDLIIAMTGEEAQACVEAIRNHLDGARQKAYELYYRKGYLALGYDSFKACVQAEFGGAWKYIYRLKDAALVEGNIRLYSPKGELIDIPETHVRDTGIKELQPEQQYEAYQTAQQLAATERTRVTARHVKTGVELVEAKQEAARLPVIHHMVASGEVTPQAGRDMVRALDKLKPQVQSQVIQLVAKHGLSSAELISPFGEMFDRPPGKESKTLETILATGRVAGTPLKKATLTDLARAKGEARAEHIAEVMEQRRHLVEPVIITVYKGDPERTYKVLKQALTASDLIKLQDFIQRGDT